jgi:hypothetical protein
LEESIPEATHVIRRFVELAQQLSGQVQALNIINKTSRLGEEIESPVDQAPDEARESKQPRGVFKALALETSIQKASDSFDRFA